MIHCFVRSPIKKFMKKSRQKKILTVFDDESYQYQVKA